MTVDLMASVGSMENAFQPHVRPTIMKTQIIKTVYAASIIVRHALAIYSLIVRSVNQDFTLKSPLDLPS